LAGEGGNLTQADITGKKKREKALVSYKIRRRIQAIFVREAAKWLSKSQREKETLKSCFRSSSIKTFYRGYLDSTHILA